MLVEIVVWVGCDGDVGARGGAVVFVLVGLVTAVKV